MSARNVPEVNGVRRPLVNLTYLIYGLQGVAVIFAVISSSSAAFGLLNFPGLVAIVLNYVKRGAVAGTWLESHFEWQIRTFWLTLLWLLLAGVLVFTLVGIFIGVLIIFVLGIWICYRVINGWLALSNETTVGD
jgi:uncharacterized membrane protein